MDKAALAEYLANLNCLLEAQREAGMQKSSTLVEEYKRGWDELKKLITDDAKET